MGAHRHVGCAGAGGLADPGAQVFKSEMWLILPNGGIFQAGGMDKPDSWRGGYADEVILDEADDTHADGQATAIEPMLADFAGVLVRSHAQGLCPTSQPPSRICWRECIRVQWRR